MDNASIGPIKISIAHLQDKNNKFVSNKEIKEIGNILSPGKVVESEEFAVVLENYLIKQLQGLNRWDEIFWVDTSPDLVDNEDPSHRGWYLLSFKEPNFGVRYSELPVEAKCLSRNPLELFEMDYTIENQIPTNYVFESEKDTDPIVLDPEITYITTTLDSDADFNLGSNGTGVTVSSGQVKVDTGQKNTSKFPTVTDNIASDGCDDVGWSYHQNIKANDAVYATVDFSTLGWSYLARGRLFGFNIPTNASITGLEVRSEHKTTCSASGQKHWYDMKVWVGGVNGQSVIHKHASTTSQSLIYWAIGGNGSGCGFNLANLTPALVNDLVIGFATSGYSSAAKGYLDYVFGIIYWRYKSGEYTTRTINAPVTGYSWNKIVVSHSIPSGCSVKYDVINASNSSVLIANATGPTIDISSIGSVNIKIKAKMTCNGSNTPVIDYIQTIQRSV